MRTWERGAGLTKACGTAACAALVNAVRTGRIPGRKAVVTVPGGDLTIEWRDDEHVMLTGPAEFEFSGELDPETGAWTRDKVVRLMAVETLTFGCRLNAYESEVARAEAEKAGLSSALIVNTCAVTAEAVRQAKQAIRKARRDVPERPIIVTGCAAQTAPRDFADMAEVDLVLGNADKLQAAAYAPMAFGVPLNDKVQVNDIMAVREQAGHLVEGFDGRARAFVQVQNGCDHRCTFCIIPYGRGPSRSVADGRGGRAGQATRRQRLSGAGADRRRHNILWRGPAGPAEPGQAGAGDPAACPRPAATAALVDQLDRGR